MKKQKEAGRCVYCLETVDDVTADHIIAESWYPEDKPENVELPTAPACEKCNHRFGALERHLREQLGFTIDPYIEGGSGIGEKSFRAIDSCKGRTEKDRNKRSAALRRWSESMVHVTDLPEEGILPNIGTLVPSNSGDYLTVSIDPVPVGKLIRKWVRGFTHYFYRRYIETETYLVQAKTVGSEIPDGIRHLHWDKFKMGPGLVIERTVDVVDPVVGMYVFNLWGRIRLIGATIPRG